MYISNNIVTPHITIDNNVDVEETEDAPVEETDDDASGVETSSDLLKTLPTRNGVKRYLLRSYVMR